jgi:hypothetical protein
VNSQTTKEETMFTKRRTIIAGVAALLAVGGAGAAVAATGALSPQEESQAILGDAAEQLGVETDELSAALKQALKNRVDAAVAAGRLTEEQGEEMKAAIDSNEFPLFGPGPGGLGHHHHFGHGAELEAAAEFLGLTEAELRTALEDGQTLAEVAEAEGKSVAGLVDAMLAAATEELEQAVEDGRLTEAQKNEILATLEERITDKVNGELGPRREFRGFGPPPAPPGSHSSSDAAFTA